MDSMQQRPLVVERIVLTFQFLNDRAERGYHDVLPYFFTFRYHLTVITTRCNQLAIRDIRLGITNNDDSKHIHIFRVESAEGSEFYHLIIATSLTNIAYRSIWRTMLQEYLLQTVELPIASMRFGIIDCCNEIANSSRHYTTFYHLPRCHQVAHRDDTHIVTNRSTQQRGCLLEGRYAWQRRNLDIGTTFTTHLVYQRSHTVDACIARRDDYYRFTLFSQFEGLLGTLAFFLHTCIDTLTTSLDIRHDKLEVILIAHYHIGLLYSLEHRGGDVLPGTRTNACYDNLSHILF